jgi:hypothetical protein
MAKGDQINIKPHFKKEGPTLPCDGEAGDLFVFTELDEGKKDPTPLGLASLWFCTKGAEGDGRNAIWQRVKFDDQRTCDVPPVKPPQNTPQLKEG